MKRPSSTSASQLFSSSGRSDTAASPRAAAASLPRGIARAAPTWLLLASLLVVLMASGCVSAASSRGWAAPVQTGETLMISPSKGKLDGIDPVTGQRKWRFPDDWTIDNDDADGLSGIYGAPIVSGDTVYVGDYNGFVYAFKPSEAGSGRPVGLFKVEGSIIGGIALDSSSNILYVPTDEGLLYALDVSRINSGDPFAFPPFDAGERIWTAPAIANGRVYFGTTDGRLLALNARTGEQIWETPFKSDAALVSTPVIAGDTVLAGGFNGRLYAIDAATGQEKWNFQGTNWIWSKPLVEGSRVYVSDFDGHVYAVDLSDGSAVWSSPFEAGTSVRASATMSDGNLVVVNDSGEMFGIDPASGRGVWGPVKVGNAVHADLTTDKNSSATVFVAPTGCTEDETAGKVFFYKVNSTTQQRQSTGSVC